MTTPYPSGTRIHTKLSSPTIFFGEPGNLKSVFALKARSKKGDYSPWIPNEYAGFVTGKTITVQGEIWQEIKLELVVWVSKLFTNYREDRLGWFKLSDDKVQSEAEYNALATTPPASSPNVPNSGVIGANSGTPIMNLMPNTGLGTTVTDLAPSNSSNTILYVIIAVAVLLVGGVLVYLFRSPAKSKKR